MKTPREPRPGRCPACSNFMNWERSWDNLWRCLGCGRIISVGERTRVDTILRKAAEALRRGVPWKRLFNSA